MLVDGAVCGTNSAEHPPPPAKSPVPTDVSFTFAPVPHDIRNRLTPVITSVAYAAGFVLFAPIPVSRRDSWEQGLLPSSGTLRQRCRPGTSRRPGLRNCAF